MTDYAGLGIFNDAQNSNATNQTSSADKVNGFSSGRYRSNPATVKTVPHARIPLSDGTELSARMWMPQS